MSVRTVRARILSFVGWALISVWSRTIRTEQVNREVLERLRSEGKNLIAAFWHGRQFLLFHSHRHSGAVIPSSESRDGEIQAGILERFGFGVVRGSSKRKGERALLGLVEALRQGKEIALAVDGPRGPLHEVKEGVVYLAGKFATPIIPVATSAKRFWTLEKAWDKYRLPKPFTRGVIVYGDPIYVRGIERDELEAKRRELQDAINRVAKQADEFVRG